MTTGLLVADAVSEAGALVGGADPEGMDSVVLEAGVGMEFGGLVVVGGRLPLDSGGI